MKMFKRLYTVRRPKKSEFSTSFSEKTFKFIDPNIYTHIMVSFKYILILVTSKNIYLE